ncbi:DUF2892 domain-containing protein [Actinobacillus genomosp. 1]|uniref:YgaP family membrane protein n=1 Tax=Actinobacillus genomosp. 1 TaxID=254839 RepID=UPI0024427DD1|nr:DUF2892 domain-containing protein [Actinobacillus genomosp. 1]WGE34483.1 DUF2892 domain-containing protein [Actinobacillus genomosp. 1]WGE36530.1 DUF2892 domain-containing protein [Actinobacillus genomosp. 1]WGE91876.1 DUF2892 domain-containing protein [Actinobacillus genomosp. 1]
MKANVGGIDKVLRIVIGALLTLLAVTGTVGIWGYLGVIILLSGVFSRCGLYALFGINTAQNCPVCPFKKK